MISNPLDLAAFLSDADTDAEIMRPGRETPTVRAAAAALGVSSDQIIKSLLFQNRRGEQVLVIARGTARVDKRKLAEASGLNGLKLAPAEVVQAVTGYPAGGVPPIGHITPLRVLIDSAIFDEPTVFGGGGTSDTMLRIHPDDIQRLTNGEVVDVCEVSQTG